MNSNQQVIYANINSEAERNIYKIIGKIKLYYIYNKSLSD